MTNQAKAIILFLVLNMRPSNLAVSIHVGRICQMEIVLCHLSGELLGEPKDLESALYQMLCAIINMDARLG